MFPLVLEGSLGCLPGLADPGGQARSEDRRFTSVTLRCWGHCRCNYGENPGRKAREGIRRILNEGPQLDPERKQTNRKSSWATENTEPQAGPPGERAAGVSLAEPVTVMAARCSRPAEYAEAGEARRIEPWPNQDTASGPWRNVDGTEGSRPIWLEVESEPPFLSRQWETPRKDLQDLSAAALSSSLTHSHRQSTPPTAENLCVWETGFLCVVQVGF